MASFGKYANVVSSSLQSPRSVSQATAAPRVAYMMSRFPKITETFILYEMLGFEEAGACVEVFPLRREKTTKMHPEAAAFVDRAHFLPTLSLEIIRDNIRMFLMHPVLWSGTLWTIIRANLGCRRLLVGALAVFPKCVTMARRMKQLRVTHIHAHFASHPAAAAWMIHQFSGIPYSFVAHGSDLHRDQNMLAEKVRDAAIVVAISNYNRQIILEKAGAEYSDKVKVIHCGVNPADFRPVKKGSSAASQDLLHVLCIGTLHEVKGQTYLIDAARIVAANGVRLKLHLIGDGPDQEMLESKVNQAGLGDLVVFEGRRDRHEIIQLLQAADILVAPSVPTANGRREGIPVVLMEAMASALPVISSRLSGIPELVKHEVNGLLTEPGDTAAIAAALQRLCDDDALRRRLGTAGQKTVEEHFNLAMSVRKILDYIISVESPSSHHRQVLPSAPAASLDALIPDEVTS